MICVGTCQELALTCDAALKMAHDVLVKFPHHSLLPVPLHRNKQGKFIYATHAWDDAVQSSKKLTMVARGVKRKFPAEQWKELRADYCVQLGVRHVPEVAEPTKRFFWDRSQLRVFAGEAGAGGDCCFLSIAASLLLAYQSTESVSTVVASLNIPVDFFWAEH